MRNKYFITRNSPYYNSAILKQFKRFLIIVRENPHREQKNIAVLDALYKTIKSIAHDKL